MLDARISKYFTWLRKHWQVSKGICYLYLNFICICNFCVIFLLWLKSLHIKLSLFFRLDEDFQNKRSRARFGMSIFIFLYSLAAWLSKECIKIYYLCTSMSSYFVDACNRSTEGKYFQTSHLARALTKPYNFFLILWCDFRTDVFLVTRIFSNQFY